MRAVLGAVETLATFTEHWLDPVSLGIVLGGTLLATLLRCGFSESRLAVRKLAELAMPAFDPARAKAEMARQIRDIASDGFLRAEPVHFGDGEFDHLADVLVSQRSLDTLHGEHDGYRRERTQAARTAMQVFQQAAELAPVLGLAGTLVALGTMPDVPSEGGMTGAIAMAVVHSTDACARA